MESFDDQRNTSALEEAEDAAAQAFIHVAYPRGAYKVADGSKKRTDIPRQQDSGLEFDDRVYRDPKTSSSPNESTLGRADGNANPELPWLLVANDLTFRSNMFTATFYVAWSREILPRLLQKSTR